MDEKNSMDRLLKLAEQTNLSPTEQSILRLIVDPEFRKHFQENAKETLLKESKVSLSKEEIELVAKMPLEELTSLSRRYSTRFMEAPETVAVLPAFVVGLAVGYAAYAYAHKY